MLSMVTFWPHRPVQLLTPRGLVLKVRFQQRGRITMPTSDGRLTVETLREKAATGEDSSFITASTFLVDDGISGAYVTPQ